MKRWLSALLLMVMLAHALPVSAIDIVLYSGNQLVVFYIDNSWAYTRLGHITDQTPAQMKALLGNGDVTIILSK